MSEKTMAALADILRENGINVQYSMDVPPAVTQHIVYSGDKDDGFRAVDIASANGYPVYRLECLWMIRSQKRPDPVWKLIF